MTTIGTIMSRATDITKIDSSTIGLAGLEDNMLRYIGESANREYYSKNSINGEPRVDRSTQSGGDIIAETTIAEALTTSLTDFDLTSSVLFPSSGALAVWRDNIPDFIEYTGNAANNLTGVTGISFSHLILEPASKLYALPADFESFRSTVDSPDGVTINGTPYRFTSAVPTTGEFNIYDNGTTKYLLFSRGTTGFYIITYNKGSTLFTTNNSIIDLPIADEDFITYRLVEHIYIVLNTELDKVQRARNLADSILLNSLKRKNVGKRLLQGRSFNRVSSHTS